MLVAFSNHRGQVMGIGYIDNIYNNSKTSWHIRSVDDRHNGVLTTDGEEFTLDDGAFHEIAANTHYHGSWCGIPWYFEGRHFKQFARDNNKKRGTRFYTSQLSDENWIIYEDAATGRQVARQKVPNNQDFHCNLRFEDEGVFIDVVNSNQFTAENMLVQILEQGKWVVEQVINIAGLIAGEKKESSDKQESNDEKAAP
ncbi:MAG: hypothetical protein HC927_02285 [Deltaproteobacteria bacterium]|nr:hypothetical protein [Deltaproteobacteria bacterium]